MMRRDRWWIREIERINREHAQREAELVRAICRLSGRPDPDETPVYVEPDEPETDFDPISPDHV